MSAEILRRAASLMRERAEKATSGPWEFRPRRGFESMGESPATIGFVDTAGYFVMVREGTWATEGDMGYMASWHPAVALAVAKAMDDVAHAWEIADESADGYVYDADDNHYRFDETVDGGWLAVARAYLGES